MPLSRSDLHSAVQPPVNAFGNHDNTTACLPLYALSSYVLPSLPGNLKFGAASPGFSSAAGTTQADASSNAAVAQIARVIRFMDLIGIQFVKFFDKILRAVPGPIPVKPQLRLDLPVRPNNHRERMRNPLPFPTGVFVQQTVCDDRLAAGITQERETYVPLRGKFFQGLRGIVTDANQGGARRLDL